MDNNLQEILKKIKSLGVDFDASEYVQIREPDDALSTPSDMIYTADDVENYINAVKTYINSLDFMRLGQAINHKQWQAAAMKAQKMSVEAKRLGITRFERPFTGIRQNINRKNSKEALQALSVMIALRVKIIEVLGIKK